MKLKLTLPKSETLRRIGMILAALLIFSYVIYHVASLFGAEIKTVVVGQSSESTSVTMDGYIFRDSSFVYSTNTGAVDFKVRNGERVAFDDEVAQVYEKGSLAESKKLLYTIDTQLALPPEQASVASVYEHPLPVHFLKWNPPDAVHSSDTV